VASGASSLWTTATFFLPFAFDLFLIKCCSGCFAFCARLALGEGRPSPSGAALFMAHRNFVKQHGANKNERGI